MNSDPQARDLQTQDDYQTRNYPPDGDTTSEGGYGAPNRNTKFSPPNQRRADKVQDHIQQTAPSTPGPGPGLIDQSPDGGPLSSELQDAQQGRDPRSREAFADAAQRDFDALSPYGRHPDSAAETEMGQRLASAYADARGWQFESGPAGGNGEDVGAF